MLAFDKGDRQRFRMVFTADNAQPGDPTVVKLHHEFGDGTKLTLTYSPADAGNMTKIQKVSDGVYEYQQVATIFGVGQYIWEGTGNNLDIVEKGMYDVSPLPFTPA